MAAAEVEQGGDVGDTTPQLGGKIPGVTYPLSPLYCGICSMPPEYCEYYPGYEQCKKWLEANCPDLLEQLTLDDGEGDKKKSKSQKRGGRGVVKTKKKSEPQTITIAKVTRNKRKYVTVIKGLGTHDIDLKKACKVFANKFSCGASVAAGTDDEIVIQGDVTDDLLDLIPEKWPQIDEDLIEDLGDQKR